MGQFSNPAFRAYALEQYREQLQDARFSGVQSLTDQNGERVVFRSQAEIERAVAAIDAELRALQQPRQPSVRYLATSKGV